MWARRCGAPPGWPSRIKVLIFSGISGTVGLSVYNYMAASNLTYLDFSEPTSQVSMCLTAWPLRSSAVDISNPSKWFDSQEEWQVEHECLHAETVACDEVRLPLLLMTRPLGSAMGPGSAIYMAEDGYTYSSFNLDEMVAWARCFLAITFFLWVGMTVHDLALAGGGAKDYVLDLMGVNNMFPVIRKTWRHMAGLHLFRVLRSDRRVGVRVLALVLIILLAPALLVWNLLVFHLLIAPLVCAIFAWRPIRMSRAWVFIVSLLSSLYGLALTLHFLILVFDKDLRPRYAATWPVEVLANGTTSVVLDGGDCVCGCNYEISFSVCANVTIIGLITLVKSIFISVRCLKGLRRTQWASLLSVLFPVPLTVYEVNWFGPEGKPIKYRQAGVPVQGEYAFDPFAMMDEQEDSAYTTVNLRPEPVIFDEDEAGVKTVRGSDSRTLAMPSIPKRSYSEDNLRGKEYVGCCGFPWRTSGKSVAFDNFEDLIQAHEELFGKQELVGEADDLHPTLASDASDGLGRDEEAHAAGVAVPPIEVAAGAADENADTTEPIEALEMEGEPQDGGCVVPILAQTTLSADDNENRSDAGAEWQKSQGGVGSAAEVARCSPAAPAFSFCCLG